MVGLVGLAASAIWAASASDGYGQMSLFVALAVCAVAANLASATWSGPILVSGSFVALMLGIEFLEPLPAVGIAVLAEVAFWIVDRYRPAALPMNLVGTAVPTALTAWPLATLDPTSTAGFSAALAGGA